MARKGLVIFDHPYNADYLLHAHDALPKGRGTQKWRLGARLSRAGLADDRQGPVPALGAGCLDADTSGLGYPEPLRAAARSGNSWHPSMPLVSTLAAGQRQKSAARAHSVRAHGMVPLM